jgi:lipopolysaccharide transport protein LptA
MAVFRRVDSMHRLMKEKCGQLRLCVRATAVSFAIAASALPLSTQAASVRTLTDPAKPIALDAASIDFNYKDNTAVYRKVRISQGDLSVEAQEATATGLNFDNSKWSFKGDVHIRMAEGKLDSQSATVTFRQNLLAHAVITGTPATFEQYLKDKSQTARGRAGSIEYDVGQGTVQFDNNAWLSDGRNEITGRTLIYNIKDERVIANPGQQEGGNISITIRPNGDGKNSSQTSGPASKPKPSNGPAQ